MAMVVKRCKKLVLQKSQRMRKGNNSNKIDSKNNKFLQPAMTLEEWLPIEQGGQEIQDVEENLGWNLVRIVIPPHPMMNRLLKQE